LESKVIKLATPLEAPNVRSLREPKPIRKSQSLASIQSIKPNLKSGGIDRPMHSTSSSLFPLSTPPRRNSISSPREDREHQTEEKKIDPVAPPRTSIPRPDDAPSSNGVKRIRFEDFISNLAASYPGVMYQDPAFLLEMFGKEVPETIDAQSVAETLAGQSLLSVLKKYTIRTLKECRVAVTSRGGNGMCLGWA
jgi:hypothetical protein